MKLCWSAIVKNESKIIARCIDSILPHIDCAVVVDTGSIDDTIELIRQAFNEDGIPLEIHRTAFVNFEQARNDALGFARASKLDWNYLLLADADMELKVDRKIDLDNAFGLAYDMKQVAGSLSYWNRRLVSRKATGQFVGVTHEYLDVAADGVVTDAWFVDHADGSNRVDKFSRDIALLTAALKTETRPGLIERYTFYLAGTYWDLGDFSKAAECYYKRVLLGGFDEERWYALMRYAMCLEKIDIESSYVWHMLKAYEMRPSRAETLYELAKFYRLRGDNHTSLLFSEAGMELRHPRTDLLFVNDWVYSHGLKEEYAICGYYSDRHRKRAVGICDKLALSGSVQARGNQYWYLRPLSDSVSSFQFEPIKFTPSDRYVAMNPSVINHDGKPLFLVRTVNYTITPEGQYAIHGADNSVSPDNPIHTRNFLGSASGQFELSMPKDWPSPQYHLVRGFEDSRLFYWNRELWTISTVRESNQDGWCEQILVPLRSVSHTNKWAYGDDWIKILPKERQHEKNWMPWVIGDELRFVYRLGILIDLHGEVIFHDDPGFDVSNISGGSQVVQIDERTWVALVHEARTIPGRPHNRYYQHRFVSFRKNGKVDRISPPFYFHDKQIEFCAGLAYFPIRNRLMVSYGVRDCEAWTAEFDPGEVIKFIYGDAL